MFFTLAILGFAVVLLGYNLDGLLPGYTTQELEQQQFTSKLSNIIENPVDAPLNLVQYSLVKLGNNEIVWLRVTSGFFAIVSSIAFYALLRKWHTNRVSLLTSAMFLSSSWVLMTARTGVPEILLTLLGSSIVTYFWLVETKKKKLALMALFVSISLLAYIPGGIFVLIAGSIWKGRTLLAEARKVPFVFFVLCIMLSVTILLPLVWAGYKDHTVILNAIGLNDKSLTVGSYLSNIWSNFLGLFVNSSRIDGAGVGKTGILDIFSITLFLAGLFTVIRKYGQDKMKYLLFGLIGSFLLAGLNQKTTITMVLPFVYLLIGTGLAWLLRQWLAVFPRNPIAKNIGVVIVFIGVGVSVYFNTYRYFVTWPHMTSTKVIYNQRP